MHRLSLILMTLLLGLQLYGQARDTIYIREEKIVYDTVYVHDTIYQPVLEEPDTPKAADSKSEYKIELFKGFHFGYVLQYNMVQRATVIPLLYDGPHPVSKLGSGFLGGVEFSYHFAKYFGVSAGFDFGTFRVIAYKNITDMRPNRFFRIRQSQFGVSFPFKFEFHIPFNDKFWMIADAGVRIDVPYMYEDWSSSQTIGDSIAVNLKNDPFVNTGLLFDLGFYYRLPNNGLLRFTIGANLSPKTFYNAYDRQDHFTGSRSAGLVTWRNNYFNTQISYIHTFQKTKEKNFHKIPWHSEKSPAWSNENTYTRHEFQLNIGDPNRQSNYSEFVGWNMLYEWFPNLYHGTVGSPHNVIYDWTTNSDSYRIAHYTPTFSFSYHYRLKKFLWIGATVNFTEFYANYFDRLTDKRTREYVRETFLDFMPDIRFSYLNRKHVTLYSALSVGIILGNYSRNVENDNDRNRMFYPNKLSIYYSYQITALGIKAGAKGWFGDLELGIGNKGFVSAGFGYEF